MGRDLNCRRARSLRRHVGRERLHAEGGESRQEILPRVVHFELRPQAGGHGEFYTTDGQGNLGFLKLNEGWRSSWTAIIPGNFGGSGFTDLLFYDPRA